MKNYVFILAANLSRLAASQIGAAATGSGGPLPPTIAGPTPPTATGAPGGGICGVGYTYCGYILHDHQGYSESAIIKAYCEDPANCSGGNPTTDPFQALYICLPGTSTGGGSAPRPLPPSSAPTSRAGGTLAKMVFKRQTAGGGGGGAASACPQPGPNRIQLLCSCGGKCLNPDEDHVGRCDKPCK